MIDVGCGAEIAWRLLATLEGASLLLVTLALLLYSSRSRTAKAIQRNVNSILISDTSSVLGQKLKQRFEARGCTVYTHTKAASNGATSAASTVDALIIVGADANDGLDGISHLVTEDVDGNINLLETLSRAVRRGGYIAWACAGKTTDSYSGSTLSFDAVLQASLQHVSKISHCEPLWVGRYAEAELAAENVLAMFFPSNITQHSLQHTFRNVAKSVSKCLDRCWKLVT